MVNKVTFAGFRGAITFPGASPLVTGESTRVDNKGSEPKARVRLLKFLEENQNFSKTHIVKSTLVIFPMVEMRTNAFREEAFAGPQSGRIQT